MMIFLDLLFISSSSMLDSLAARIIAISFSRAWTRLTGFIFKTIYY